MGLAMSGWGDRIYRAGASKVDRDPDLDAVANANEVIDAALRELALVLDERGETHAAQLVRDFTE